MNEFIENDAGFLWPRVFLFAVLSLTASSVFAAVSKNEEESNRLRIEQIGQKVCSATQGDDVTMTEPSPLFANSYMTYKGHAELVGFVEKYSGHKIQIRIAGLTFVGRWDVPNNNSPESEERKPMRTFDNYKGLNLQIGSLIWENYYDWSPCE